eukprot:5063499-Pyramimonas_sp.AAC.1
MTPKRSYPVCFRSHTPSSKPKLERNRMMPYPVIIDLKSSFDCLTPFKHEEALGYRGYGAVRELFPSSAEKPSATGDLDYMSPRQ